MKAKPKGPPVLAAVLDKPNVHILGQPKPRIVRPLHDWHVLEEIPGATHTPGGIEIPANKRVAEARIIASGPGRVNGLGNTEPMVGKPGDVVVFEGQAKQYLVDGVWAYCIRDVLIVGVVERNPKDVEPAPAPVLQ